MRQIVPQQQGTMVRPQMTLAQPPMVTLKGPTHSRIIVGQLQTGVCVNRRYTPFISTIQQSGMQLSLGMKINNNAVNIALFYCHLLIHESVPKRHLKKHKITVSLSSFCCCVLYGSAATLWGLVA